MTAPIISIPKNFHMNLIQFDHSIFAIAREPIRQPEVGTIRFVKASPSWNARTDVWRDTPRRSASGAMIGMVIAAWPEPDTTKKLKTDWNTYISTAAAAPERPARACEMPYIMVLITVGVVGSEPPSTCMMPCAIATQFFIMGIVAGVIGVIFHLNNMKVNDIAVSFKDGAKDLIGAAQIGRAHV